MHQDHHFLSGQDIWGILLVLHIQISCVEMFVQKMINLANVCQQENKKYRGKKRVTLINLPIVDFLEIYDNELGFTCIAPLHEHSKFGETY